MNFHAKKGEHGYLDAKKIKQLLYTLIFVLLVALMFFTGYIRYHSTKTIFTVLAVLWVLPAAKQAVIYLILFPYHSGEAENYKTLKPLADTVQAALICDMVFTTQDAVGNVDFICIKDGRLLCYVTHPKTKTEFVKKHVREIVSPYYTVKAVQTFTDFKKYVKAVEGLGEIGTSEYDLRTAEKILAYCV